MLAAVCDLPRTCQGCGGQPTPRPVRKRTPLISSAQHFETGDSHEGYGEDDLMGLVRVLAIFGNKPHLGFKARIQV